MAEKEVKCGWCYQPLGIIRSATLRSGLAFYCASCDVKLEVIREEKPRNNAADFYLKRKSFQKSS